MQGNEDRRTSKVDRGLISATFCFAYLYPLLWAPFRFLKSPYQDLAIAVSKDLLLVLLVVLGVRGLVLAFSKRSQLRELRDPVKPVLFCVILVLAAWLSLLRTPGEGIEGGFRQALILTGGIGLFLLVRANVSNLRDSRKLFLLGIGCIGVILAATLMVYARGIWIGKYDLATEEFGVFFHSSNMGTLLVTATIMTLALTRKRGRGLYLVPMALLLIVFLFSIFLTRARGAWLALFVSTFVMGLVASDRRWRRGLSLGASGIVLAVVLLFLVAPGFADRYLNAGIRFFESMGYRWTLWKTMVEIASHSPFLGIGLGSFELIPKEIYQGPYAFAHTHNQYLQFLVSTGILGFLSFLGILVTTLVRGFRGLLGEIRPRSPIRVAELAIVLVYLVSFFFDSKLKAASATILFFTFLGMISARTDRTVP
jgi:O-antigen ligase